MRCRFCVWSSPPSVRSPRGTARALDKAIADAIFCSSRYHFKRLTITGGGEPFLAMDRLCHLLTSFRADTILITTSATWATSRQRVDAVLRKLAACLRARNVRSGFTLNISLDEYHQERIPLANIERVVACLSGTSGVIDDVPFSLQFRTLWSDGCFINNCTELLGGTLGPLSKNVALMTLPDGYQVRFVHMLMLFAGRARDIPARMRVRYLGVQQYMQLMADHDGHFRPMLFHGGLNCTLTTAGEYIHWCGNPLLDVSAGQGGMRRLVNAIATDALSACVMSCGLDTLLELGSQCDPSVAATVLHSNNHADILPAIVASPRYRDILPKAMRHARNGRSGGSCGGTQ